MPHTLYTFGLDVPPHAHTTSLPHPVRHAQRIRILWKSWCDGVIAYQDAHDTWTVEYTGLGLTLVQKERVEISDDVKAIVSGRGGAIQFFGSVMHDGLRGFVLTHNQLNADVQAVDKVILFATDLEIENGTPECQVYPLDTEDQLVDIKLASGGDVLVSLRTRSTGEGRVLHVQSLAALRSYLASSSLMPHETIAPFSPMEWSMSSTTATAVNKDGQLFTYTRDPRYPKCLGRPSESAEGFQPVAYLSETSVVRIASGGYLTSAISADGELFVWGQACPGSAGELGVLNEATLPADNELASVNASEGTKITGVSEQDELVKCLDVRVAGKEAIVSDVAVGFGHVLVAAEVPGGGERAVLAAGSGTDGQLGLGMNVQFQGEFQEILTLRGKRVVQLVAAGWSSALVVDG